MYATAMNEKDYQAESDMRTLAQAGVIRADKKRLKAAIEVAKKQVKELEAIDPKAEDSDD